MNNKKTFRGATSVIGNVLLVGIVFLMATAFAGIVVLTDFQPTPEAKVDIEQINNCTESQSGGCQVKVTVSQMINSEYIIVTYDVPNGLNKPELVDEQLIEDPKDINSVPDNITETNTFNNENGQITEYSSILLNSGDTHKGGDIDVGTEVNIYAGIDGNENLIKTFEVQENNVVF